MACMRLCGVLLFLFTVSIVTLSNAATVTMPIRHYVNGRQGWGPYPSQNFIQWAGSHRFSVNDTLYFRYDKEQDSVLEVNEQDYKTCNTDHPISKQQGGESEISLPNSGPFYFISGNKTRCDGGEKMIVKVLSSYHTPPPSSPPTSAPAPKTYPGPIISPPSSSGPAMSPSSGISTPVISGPAMSPSSGTPTTSGPATSPTSASGPAAAATSPAGAPTAGMTPSTATSPSSNSPANSPASGVTPAITSTSPPGMSPSGASMSPGMSPSGSAADATAPGSKNAGGERVKGLTLFTTTVGLFSVSFALISWF